jgi:ABC-type multidrug transport system fused ATPase/permease subunit
MAFVSPPASFLMPPPISGSQQEFLARNKPAKTQVQRPPSSALLCIDSEDRYKDYEAKRAANYTDINGSPYDFQITKNESMMSGFMTRLGVTEVVFPWVIPNINLYTQSIIFKWAIGAGPVNQALIAIVPGFYTPSQLAATIQFAVRTSTPITTFTMTYGQAQLPNFQYAGDPGVPGTLVGWDPLPYNSASYPYGPQTKQLFDVLGFSQASGLTNSVVQDAENATNVETINGKVFLYGGDTFAQSIRYIDIVCSQLTYNQGLKDTMSQKIARDSLCRLYVANDGSSDAVLAEPQDEAFAPVGTFPFTIHRQFATPKMIQWTPNQPVPGGLRFEVYDDAGNNLVFASSKIQQLSDWGMTLLVTEN